jgi:ferredoxin-NADP reductase
MSLTTTLLRSRVVEALASPHGVDRYLEIVNPMWAAREVRARIVDIRREVDVPGHPPVATITLQPTSTWAGHRAGQHVQLGVDVPGAKRLTRVFTISSSDSKPGERFTITMRANPAGQVS